MITLLESLRSPTGDQVVPAPGTGTGFWAGGPSAVAADGAVWLAYRLRRPVDQGRGYANVLARSADGGRHFDEVARLSSEQLGAARWSARPWCGAPTAAGACT
jgi:hypothetical protein